MSRYKPKAIATQLCESVSLEYRPTGTEHTTLSQKTFAEGVNKNYFIPVAA